MIQKSQRLAEALAVLTQLGMPAAQRNERTAICLLALLDLPLSKNWQQAQNPLLGIRAMLDFAREKLDWPYAENTRESLRKYSVKQLVAAGIVLHNPDRPDRAVNSSDNCYQVETNALALLQQFGLPTWQAALSDYLARRPTLAAQFARQRVMQRIPLVLNDGQALTLSAGAHSDLIRAVIEEFTPRFVSAGQLVYVGDTGKKWGYFDDLLLQQLGITVGKHGKMPDVIVYDRTRNWLILIEAVISSGPVDGIRHAELSALFQASTAGLVFVTAFSDRGDVMRKFLSVVAWETEVWCASDPTHLIHFNGVRFLGPYAKS